MTNRTLKEKIEKIFKKNSGKPIVFPKAIYPMEYEKVIGQILSLIYSHLEKKIDEMYVDYHYDDGYEAGWMNRGQDIKQILKQELLGGEK